MIQSWVILDPCHHIVSSMLGVDKEKMRTLMEGITSLWAPFFDMHSSAVYPADMDSFPLLLRLRSHDSNGKCEGTFAGNHGCNLQIEGFPVDAHLRSHCKTCHESGLKRLFSETHGAQWEHFSQDLASHLLFWA